MLTQVNLCLSGCTTPKFALLHTFLVPERMHTFLCMADITILLSYGKSSGSRVAGVQLSKIIKHLQAQLEHQEAVRASLEGQLAKALAELGRLQASEANQQETVDQACSCLHYMCSADSAVASFVRPAVTTPMKPGYVLSPVLPGTLGFRNTATLQAVSDSRMLVQTY